MTEDEKLDYMVDNLAKRMEDFFYEHNGEIIIGEPDYDDPQIKITWSKWMSVLKVCDFSYVDYYDDRIECLPGIFKANTMEEAWEHSKKFVYDYLNYYFVDQERLNELDDFILEDGSISPEALDVYFKILVTWKNYILYYDNTSEE